MVICCRHKNMPFVSVRLKNIKQFTNRRLDVAVCSVCGAIIAELTQFNTNRNEIEVIRPKRKQVASFIRKMEHQVLERIEVKTGTKSNMNYVYGLNREHKNGKIYQYAVDFNGEKKLVKIVEQKLGSNKDK